MHSLPSPPDGPTRPVGEGHDLVHHQGKGRLKEGLSSGRHFAGPSVLGGVFQRLGRCFQREGRPQPLADGRVGGGPPCA